MFSAVYFFLLQSFSFIRSPALLIRYKLIFKNDNGKSSLIRLKKCNSNCVRYKPFTIFIGKNNNSSSRNKKKVGIRKWREKAIDTSTDSELIFHICFIKRKNERNKKTRKPAQRKKSFGHEEDLLFFTIYNLSVTRIVAFVSFVNIIISIYRCNPQEPDHIDNWIEEKTLV